MRGPEYRLSKDTVRLYRRVLSCAFYGEGEGKLSEREINAVDLIVSNMGMKSFKRAVSYYVHGKTIADIAKADGVNISTVSRTIDIVNRKLADVLNVPEWYDKFRLK